MKKNSNPFPWGSRRGMVQQASPAARKPPLRSRSILMTESEIRETFRYHSASADSVAKHEAIRSLMTETTVEINKMLPSSKEASLFITLMQIAQMMANASIAIHSEDCIKQSHDPTAEGKV